MSAHQSSLYRETLTFLQIKRKTANGLFPLSLPTLIFPHCSFSPPATAPATKQASTTITTPSGQAQALLTAQKPRVVPKVGFGHSLLPLPTPHSSSRLCCYRHLSSCLAWLWDHLNLIGGTSWTAIWANSLQFLQTDAAGVSMKICLIVWTRRMLCENARQPNIIL